MIPPEFLNELKSRLTLSSVVGRRVKLTKKGREYEGLCPFHNEKTPSFTVNDDKGFCHCFGCGAHADVIQFVMRTEGRDFIEAVEILAEDVGLDMPKASPEERVQAARQASLHQAMEAACVFFTESLRRAAGTAALAYLHGRGLVDETIDQFRLGFAPAGDALRRALPRDVFPDDLLVEAGLLRRRDDGSLSAFFRDRVTFPIMDGRGRVIGFGARTMGNCPPKYLNSPDTPLFRKGEVLFGQAIARGGIERAGMVLGAEGYLDVIVLHQAGFDFAVAPLGTALTEGQLEQMWRLSDQVVLCLDGDGAGARAMKRAMERALPLLRPGRSLEFVSLVSGHDPDSLIRDRGADAMSAALRTRIGTAEMIWQVQRAECWPDTPERLAALERRLFAAAGAITDAYVRRAMLAEFRRRLRVYYRPTPPRLLVGRSKRKFAPAPISGRLAGEWQAALAAAGPVRDWLGRLGIAWGGLDEALGGVGLVRARVAKGRWVGQWDEFGKPELWEPVDDGDKVSLVVIPEWEGAPGGALVDLIAWNPRDGKIASRTGSTAVLGEAAVAEALAIEANGLPHPLAICADIPAWLRRRAGGDPAVMIFDWARAWDVLGGLRQLVAEHEAFAEELYRRLKPPRPKGPEIMFSVGGEND